MTTARTQCAALVLTLMMLVVPQAVRAENISELHILPDGSLTVKAAVVTQKSGSNLFCKVAWGNTFIRITVLAHTETEVVKKFGGKATVEDIQEGDTLEVSGLLSDGTGNLIVNAKKIKDSSITTESKTVAGTIASVDTAKGTVKVAVKGLGTIQVVPSASLVIQKGLRSTPLRELSVGDKILSASGTYDFATQTLNATLMEVYQDKKIFAARTFEGTVAGITGGTLPTTVTITSSGKTYTVYLSETTKVTSKSKSTIALSRVAVGDKVSISGSIKETNLDEIAATALRDLAF